MRRTFASVTACVVFGVAASAGAATNIYRGDIVDDEKATVELEFEIRDGRSVLTDFSVRKFPLECEGGTAARLDRARLAGRARVSGKGRFALGASNGTQRLRVEGRLRGPDGASGSVAYSGMTEFADQTLDCETTGLRWTATR
jgi:hypothetical protein